MLIWHLYQAALAGRDIYYDQRYRHSLEMREVLEEILMHGDAVAPDVLAEIRRYTKLFWINSGPHNNLTARKFVLHVHARGASRGGACSGRTPARAFRSRPARRSTPCSRASRARSSIRAVDPLVTSKTPGKGRDILTASANNLYESA